MIVSSKNIASFDVRSALGKLDGDVVFLKDLAYLFVDTLPERLASLSSAMQVRDLQLISDIAHSIKGSVRFFIADAAYEAARQLESVSATGQRREHIENACDQLLSELEQLRLELLLFLTDGPQEALGLY